jgi:hypothetical protein
MHYLFGDIRYEKCHNEVFYSLALSILTRFFCQCSVKLIDMTEETTLERGRFRTRCGRQRFFLASVSGPWNATCVLGWFWQVCTIQYPPSSRILPEYAHLAQMIWVLVDALHGVRVLLLFLSIILRIQALDVQITARYWTLVGVILILTMQNRCER